MPYAKTVLAGVVVMTAFGAGRAPSVEPPGQDRMFSEADSYERFMGRWSRQLAPLLVDFAGVRDGDRLLDVGSGTGALAAAMAAAAPTARIIGIDPSSAYVAMAESRHGGPLVRFQVGDAQRIDFPDATFDRSVSLLVVNFIPDAHKAVEEMIRVTRRGGTLAAAVWDYGEGMDMLRIFWDEAVKMTPSADSRDERHMPYSRQGDLENLWRQHGLQDVVGQGVTIETRFASFADYWNPFLERQGPAGAYVAQLPVSNRQELEKRLRARLLGQGPDRAVVLTARAWAVRGVVP